VDIQTLIAQARAAETQEELEDLEELLVCILVDLRGRPFRAPETVVQVLVRYGWSRHEAEAYDARPTRSAAEDEVDLGVDPLSVSSSLEVSLHGPTKAV
jgi:hypothetical protein